jgi:hypothetical protein
MPEYSTVLFRSLGSKHGRRAYAYSVMVMKKPRLIDMYRLLKSALVRKCSTGSTQGTSFAITEAYDSQVLHHEERQVRESNAALDTGAK